MQIVCEATQSINSPDIQVIGFECLVKIVGLYYDHMELYMQKALFGLTVLGMRHDNEKVLADLCRLYCRQLSFGRRFARSSTRER